MRGPDLNGVEPPRFFPVQWRDGGYIIVDRRGVWRWNDGRIPYPSIAQARAECEGMNKVFCPVLKVPEVDEWPN